MSTKLILIRHGETDWSYQKRYCGFTDIPLNEKGKAQARQLSKRLEEEKVHKVYSSDMKRTLQFAKIVFKDAPIERLASLREMNLGMFEGLTYQEIMEAYPEIYRKWLNDPRDVTIPGGEGLNDLAKRVRESLIKILSHDNSNSNRTIAVFTHAGPIRVILCDILNLGLKEFWQIEQDLANFNIIEFVKGKNKIHLLNDTSYLNG